MTTDADAGTLRTVHEHRGVPPDETAEGPLHVLVTGEPRFLLQRDGVDVVRRGERGDADLTDTGVFQEAEHDVSGSLLPLLGDEAVERFSPLLRLIGVDVGEATR
ncbi:hypothetical protein GCM10025883_14050 [Mobilicoccus caccae]|uniref:Uncharacterized protein n=1 Tax=Mobilicoccus caccae TaxID=1859295 RepID=A0ABQ6IPV6_9MICO|nr:hypothetical protein GCM10025883_14050 [Mobilicoccus caccae]